MRKLFLSLGCMLLMTGLVVAAEVTLVKYDAAKKEVTVKEGDKEATYKITDKTKIVFIDKDGNAKEGTLEAVEKILSNEKAAGKAKFDVTADKGTATELKFKLRKGK
jgi:hypothetical protein